MIFGAGVQILGVEGLSLNPGQIPTTTVPGIWVRDQHVGVPPSSFYRTDKRTLNLGKKTNGETA